MRSALHRVTLGVILLGNVVAFADVHFAQGIELALPAALVLPAAAGRPVSRTGRTRERVVVRCVMAACWVGIVWGVAGRRGGTVGKGGEEAADGD